MNKAKTSPLKDRPLRYVAQSLDEALDDLLHYKLLTYYLVAVFCGGSIIFEWLRFFQPRVAPPVFLSVIYGIGFCFCALKLFKHIKKVKAMKLGRDGERAVGQYLELFRESGCHVYHDILGDSFNVDHVVISPKGVFVIETKTFSKPSKGNSNITFDGKQIYINGREPIKDIVTQTKASASYIKKILVDSTGRDYSTFPVVLFPGWFVEGEGNKKGKMWVLEPKAFRKFLDRQQAVLSPEEVSLASYNLSRHIRGTQKSL